MTRPDYCPVAQEPCQAMCVLSDVRCKIRDTPPKAPVPLDAGEISRLWKRHTDPDGPHHNPYDDDGLAFARAIEAAHNIKEKNT